MRLRRVQHGALVVTALAVDDLVQDDGPLHPVLEAYLADRADQDDPVFQVVRSWGRRDPVDASLDARLLWQRLRRDGASVSLQAPVRFAVVRVHQDWTTRLAPADYLHAAERLADLMNRWADAVLNELISNSPQPHLPAR